MIELAVLLPVLLILIGALIDGGRAFSQAGVITNAAREGVRYGCTNASNATNESAIKDQVVEEATGSGVLLDRNDIVITSVDSNANGKLDSGDALTVQVTFQLKTFMSGIVGVKTITTVRKCTMVIL